MSSPTSDPSRPNALELGVVEAEVLKQLRSLSFGSIEIVVHDARIVQIERREKLRFDQVPKQSA